MKNKLFFTFLYLHCWILAFAQFNLMPCASDLFLQEQEQRDKSLLQQQQELEAQIQAYLRQSKEQASPRNPEVFTIPVVVHIVWYTEEENISDERVHSQVAILNEDFRGRNLNSAYIPAEFAHLAADVGFEFCLATVDPEDLPTTGITRTQTDYNFIGNYGLHQDNRGNYRLFQTILGGQDAWDTNQYLNIWVAGTGGEFQGFGIYPNNPDFETFEDGIIVDPQFFGNNCELPFHLGRVTTHEIGHYFNLRHLWGRHTGCDTDDDLVEDTPFQEREHSGCPSYPAISCGTSDMFMNFMDYTDDACLSMFTLGQKDRMVAALQVARAGLLTSNGCAAPRPIPNGSFRVYPNPARHCVYIQWDRVQEEVVEVHLFDAAGRLVYQATHLSANISAIPVESLPPGVYFLRLQIGDESLTERVLID